MPDVTYVLKEKKQLTRDVYELIFEGDTSSFNAPGQFVNIALEGFYLRRPISVCDISDGLLTLIIRRVGAGTRKLCASELGSKYDMLTALGNGFDIEKAPKKCIVAGGGVGAPPMYCLAKKLMESGREVYAALGFNTADDVFYSREFADVCTHTEIATVDGSFGTKGFVTDIIAMAQSGYEYVFACGPEAMLKAVYDMPRISDGQFSFEERMGCGFGACMGCTCKTKYGYKRICTDGPVLLKEEIIW